MTRTLANIDAFPASFRGEMSKTILAVCLTAVCAFPLFGAAPYRVHDINTTWSDAPRSSSPRRFLDIGGRALFAAASDEGEELWVTDGTPDGTKMVRDINPGPGDSSPLFFPFGTSALFFATDALHGRELWRTDGTPAGTSLVKDITPGPASAIDLDRAVLQDGKLIFAVRSPANGQPATLWSSDGTPAGTKLFFTYKPETGVAGGIYDLTAVNRRIVVRSTDGLWSTDGTSSQLLFKNMSLNDPLIVLGGRLFFIGEDINIGVGLYVTDGTKAGTRLVYVRTPPPYETTASLGMTPLPNGVMFNGSTGGVNTNLFVSDGTESGTHILGGFPSRAGSNNQLLDPAAPQVNGFTYFIYYDQLWRTDGTDAGTTRVAPQLSGISNVEAVGHIVYFAGAEAGAADVTLRAYDTASGVLRTVYASNGQPLVFSNRFAPFGDKTVFDGELRRGDGEPWITDGTSSGTFELAEIAPNAPASSNPATLVAAGDSLVFSATADGTQRGLWRTDGTDKGTTQIRGTFPSSYFERKRFSWRDRAYVKTDTELWSIDSAGTVSKPSPTTDSSIGRDIAPGPDAIYIAGYSANFIRWDGVSAKGEVFYGGDLRDNVLVDDFIGKPVFGGYQVLAFLENGQPETMWQWGGTFYITRPVVAGGYVYVLATDDKHLEVWRSDGTPTGTEMVVSVPDVRIDHENQIVMAAGTRIFFFATDAEHGRELWTTDGTVTGTHITKDIAPGATSSALTLLARLGDRLLFTADDGTTGREPWITDGTPEGTKLVKDIFPGKSGSRIFYAVVLEGRAYFEASAADGTQSLWQSDGTEAGTTSVTDLFNSEGGHQLTVAGGRVYYTNSDDAGNELWALPVDPVSRLTIADLRMQEGEVARFAVTLTHPSDRRITVDYTTNDVTATAGSDYAASSGSLVFEAGETRKEIAIQTIADALDENYEVFRVTLKNPAGAEIDRAVGSALIEGPTPAGDLQLFAELRPHPGDSISTPFVKVKNNGPATIANTTLQFTITPVSDGLQKTSVRDLTTGAEATWKDLSDYRAFVRGFWWASATTTQRDSNLANNTVIGQFARDKTGGILSFAPAALHPDETAFLEVAASNLNSSMTAVSSNASVASVGALTFEPMRATATLTARSAGTATISVAGVGEITLSVLQPGEALKLSASINASTACCAQVGHDFAIYITLLGLTPSGARPTGTLSIEEGSELRGTATVGQSFTTLPIDPGATGRHSYTIRYSGDANFSEQSAPWTVDTSMGDPKIELTAQDLPDGQTKITLTITGSPLATPTGTVSFNEIGQPALSFAVTAVRPGVVSASRTFQFSPGHHTVSAVYAGNGNYSPASAQITVGPRRRTTPH